MTTTTTTPGIRIAVIGAGPRGMTVLERVISLAQLAGPPIELILIEPGELGIGIHQPKQPDYLLLNTIASQLTIFSDPAMTPGAPVTTGPSLFEWCQGRGGAARFDDFLPRRLLGEYLQWAAGELLARVPDRLTVRHRHAVAVDVRPGRAGGAGVTLADGVELAVDLAVVTTGHGLDVQALPAVDGLIGVPYPLPDQVEPIPAGATVALLGSGLTTMDVIAALTVGRGGVFDDGDYRPSGREPRIVLANRSGRLPCSRPATTAERRPAPARYLTPAAVDELRRNTPDGRLDFRRDLEPLILAEARARMAGATPAEFEAVERILQPPDDGWSGYQEYGSALLERARHDLREAERGLGVSLVKEGLEVLRDHREGLRAAVDGPGLTEQSHRYFMAEYVPLVNRAVIGPQKERIRELLILLAQGIVQLGPGPHARLTRTPPGWELASTRLERPHRIAVDVVVKANLSWPTGDPGLDPIAVSLRTWVAPGRGGELCLGLDRDGFARPRAGQPGTGTVAVFGPPAEGASYYNHYVPSPGVWSRALTDLDRALAPVLGGRPRTVELPVTAESDRSGPLTVLNPDHEMVTKPC